MHQFQTLDIRIRAQTASGYPVEMILDKSREFRGGTLLPTIVPWIPTASAETDQRQLTDHFLADPTLKAQWHEIRGLVAKRRIRLSIDPDACALMGVPWELLTDQDAPLTASHNTPFSRYIAGQWPSGAAIAQRPLRLLVAIANPDDLDDFGLASVDVTKEIQNLEAALAAVPQTAVSMTVLDGPVTLERLEAALYKEPHILHLVAHGYVSRKKQQAQLYLADSDNDVALIKASAFTAMLQRLAHQPSLVFLSSCHSASSPRSPEAQLALAPGLIEAGIPAVIAMQDAVSMATARAFDQTFYQRLLHHGIVDLAVNEARSQLMSAERPDSRVPVLFSRLPDGQLLDMDQAAPEPPTPGKTITQTGSGNIIEGDRNVTASGGSVAIGGDLHGNLVIGQRPTEDNE